MGRWPDVIHQPEGPSPRLLQPCRSSWTPSRRARSTASTPHDIALLRRLQGTLAGWDEALGKGSQPHDHTG